MIAVLAEAADAHVDVDRRALIHDAERNGRRRAVLVAGEVLWESGSGTPLCIAANVSDIMPDTQITVTAADGTAVIYQPFLSLRDGSLAVPEDGTVYDFTVYPEGFVRETTA